MSTAALYFKHLLTIRPILAASKGGNQFPRVSATRRIKIWTRSLTIEKAENGSDCDETLKFSKAAC
jgi:hypothetical protein